MIAARARSIAHVVRDKRIWGLPAPSQKINASIHPLCEIVAGLQLGLDLRTVHGLVLGQVLGILPLEELDAVLCVWLAPKVAIGGSLLVFGLTQGKRKGNGTWAAIKGQLDNICDVVSAQVTLLSAVSLHKDREGLCDTNGIGELHEGTLAQATLHNGLGYLPADVGSGAVNFGWILLLT